MSGIGSHTLPNRGQTNEWMTPPDILEALGQFDDDPTTKGTSGLNREWKGRIFINPPYGPDTRHWLRRLAMHKDGIALVFARTETKMFFDSVWNDADALLFIEGRLHFYRPDGARAKGNAGGPSVLIAYGRRNADCLKHCGISGKFVVLKNG